MLLKTSYITKGSASTHKNDLVGLVCALCANQHRRYFGHKICYIVLVHLQMQIKLILYNFYSMLVIAKFLSRNTFLCNSLMLIIGWFLLLQKNILIILIACNELSALFIVREICEPHCSLESKVSPSTFILLFDVTSVSSIFNEIIN
jgi:hypothetical protein